MIQIGLGVFGGLVAFVLWYEWRQRRFMRKEERRLALIEAQKAALLRHRAPTPIRHNDNYRPSPKANPANDSGNVNGNAPGSGWAGLYGFGVVIAVGVVASIIGLLAH